VFTRHFHINDSYFGSATEHRRQIHAQLDEPQHYAMFCPSCGDLWARMPVDGVTTLNWWRIIGGCCEKCQPASPYVLAGSLIMNWEPDLQKILPEAVVRREFELHLKWMEGLCPRI
jgi:hypothetical protein